VARTQLGIIGPSEFIEQVSLTEFIEQVSLTAAPENVELSKPAIVESPVDALDAPIGGEGIQGILETVTVSASSNGALALFLYKVNAMFKQQKEGVLEVRDPASGARLGTITSETSEKEIEEILSQ
jgi:hypothetical protein